MTGQMGHGLGMSNVGLPPVSNRGYTPMTQLSMPGLSDNYPSLETLTKLCNQVAPPLQPSGMIDTAGSFGAIGSACPKPGSANQSPGSMTPTFTPSSKFSL